MSLVVFLQLSIADLRVFIQWSDNETCNNSATVPATDGSKTVSLCDCNGTAVNFTLQFTNSIGCFSVPFFKQGS
jgi:hypothetical protein